MKKKKNEKNFACLAVKENGACGPFAVLDFVAVCSAVCGQAMREEISIFTPPHGLPLPSPQTDKIGPSQEAHASIFYAFASLFRESTSQTHTNKKT